MYTCISAYAFKSVHKCLFLLNEIMDCNNVIDQWILREKIPYLAGFLCTHWY